MPLRPINSDGGFSTGANNTTVIDGNANVSANSLTVLATSNLGAISNVVMTGGNTNQVITTDGNGVLSFSNRASGSNGQIQFNTAGNLDSTANLVWNSGSNLLQVPGPIEIENEIFFTTGGQVRTGSGTFAVVPNLILEGNLVTLANSTQFNANGTVTWAVDVKFNKVANLGAVGNVVITGGNNGFYLQTDGSGNLAWVSGGGSGNGETGGSNTQIQFNDGGNFGGSGALTFNKTTNTLAVTGNLTVSGGTANLGNVGNVKIIGGSDGQYLRTDGNGTLIWGNVDTVNINRTSILFDVTSNGNNQQFTNANLEVFANNNSYAQLFFNGVLMNTTEYDISGNMLTVNRYLRTDDQIVVGPIVQTVAVPGSNTQVVYNNNGNFDASAIFTVDIDSNVVTITGNTVSNNFIGTLANGNSNIAIGANSNITISAEGNTVVTINGSEANITGNIVANNAIINTDLTVNTQNWSSEWSTYSPSWTASSSNPAIGNGTIVGRYKQTGKTVQVYARVAMGNTTTFGSGTWRISLPVTASNDYNAILNTVLLDAGTRWYQGVSFSAYEGNSTYVTIFYNDAPVSSTAPFTWADGDSYIITGTYEAQ
jgi:hypothetical protein